MHRQVAVVWCGRVEQTVFLQDGRKPHAWRGLLPQHLQCFRVIQLLPECPAGGFFGYAQVARLS
jgi:hypothetical protein